CATGVISFVAVRFGPAPKIGETTRLPSPAPYSLLIDPDPSSAIPVCAPSLCGAVRTIATTRVGPDAAAGYTFTSPNGSTTFLSCGMLTAPRRKVHFLIRRRSVVLSRGILSTRRGRVSRDLPGLTPRARLPYHSSSEPTR